MISSSYNPSSKFSFLYKQQVSWSTNTPGLEGGSVALGGGQEGRGACMASPSEEEEREEEVGGGVENPFVFPLLYPAR